MVSVSFSANVYADSFDDQIAAAQARANAAKATASAYQAQADSAEARIIQLQSQMNALQAQISVNQAKVNKLNAQMKANETQLKKQRDILGANIKTMYLSANVSPIEMLASSKSLGDFFDQQQYRDSIKTKIQDAMKSVLELQAKLKADKERTDKLLADQRTQRQQLAAQKAEADRLLAAAAANAAAADQLVRGENARIQQLRAQQAAALAAQYGGAVGGGACGGGYPGSAPGPWGPWGCNYPKDNAPDNWGMYNRECVSYTAFRVATSGRTMPYWGGHGNANQWPGNAQAAGIPVNNTPRAGDVAISMLGPYGHAMYVEQVNGNNVTVSQYNYGNNGEYSVMTIPKNGLQFIHFR